MSTRPLILIVDDDHDVLDLLEVLLFTNHDVVTAMNGFEGLKKATELVPSLIVTDILMPVMDGIKFFNSLRKAERTASVPVIAITSFTEAHSVRSLLSLGFSDVVPKPFSRESVLKTVSTALGQHRPEMPPTDSPTDRPA